MVTYSSLAAPLLLLLVCAQLCRSKSVSVDDVRAENLSRRLEQSGKFKKYGNSFLYQNDMLLSGEQAMSVLERQLSSNINLWPRKVPYFIDDDPEMEGGYIQKSLQHVADETCLEFIKEENHPGLDATPYMNFMKKPGKNAPCTAALGWAGTGPEDIKVGKDCGFIATTHEILHSLGLDHEQARGDRDKYITVMTKNIDSEGSPKDPSTKQFGAPYDYYSLMQYGPQQGSANNKFVFKAFNPLMQTVMGRGARMSYYDAKIINTAYKCIDDWTQQCPEITCHNDGYVFKGCKCRCPEGTTGDKCENKEMSYDDGVIEKYFLDSGIVTSPGEIGNINKVRAHSKVIDAPECKKVVLTVTRFDSDCSDSYLNIISSGVVIDDGIFFCGDQIEAGTEFESTGSKMILHFKGMPAADGYRADVTFEDLPGCKLI